MAQYIDKDALVAEIKRLLKCDKFYKSEDVETRNSVLEFILSFIDTLEVKEVDLEEEINNYFNRISHFGKIHLTPEYDNIKVSTMTIDGFASIAKHFFELGLKAQKGE